MPCRHITQETSWVRRLARGLPTSVLLTSVLACSGDGGAGDSTSAESSGSGAQESGRTDVRPLILPELQACDGDADPMNTVRVASWNMSAARRSSLGDVAAVLAELDADVVLLQEVDVGVDRTGNVDQPALLAEQLGYEHAFAASIRWDGGDFGLAVLSRLPFESGRRIPLDAQGSFEPRIAFDVTLCAGPTPVRFVNVHADFIDVANLHNLTDLAAEIGDLSTGRVVIAGDLNAEADAEGVVNLIARTGTLDTFASRDPGPTRKQKRIDFVLATEVIDSAITNATRVETEASDHRALLLDFVP